MSKKRSWTEDKLRYAVENSYSLRQVIHKLGLREAGGNYSQIQKYIEEFSLDYAHFKGKGWNMGMSGISRPRFSLDEILVQGSHFQSHKLKKRLFTAGLKEEVCEECNWAKRSDDGRIPLELDHINGNNRDNRLENLRVLCPNCHSLKPTHRGRNRVNKNQV